MFGFKWRFGFTRGAHGAEFQDSEFPLLVSGAFLSKEEGSGSLFPLHQLHEEAQRREDEKDYGQRYTDICGAFDKPVERILQRLRLQSKEGVVALSHGGEWLVNILLPVVEDEHPAAFPEAGVDNVVHPCLRFPCFEENHLINFILTQNVVEIGDVADNGEGDILLFVFVVADHSDYFHSEGRAREDPVSSRRAALGLPTSKVLMVLRPRKAMEDNQPGR